MRVVYKTLNDDEYNVLCKIAHKTKMDCWFCIKQKKDGTDYIYDLENGKRMCLKAGVSQLVEGIDCWGIYQNCDLSTEEKQVFQNLLKKLRIVFC